MRPAGLGEINGWQEIGDLQMSRSRCDRVREAATAEEQLRQLVCVDCDRMLAAAGAAAAVEDVLPTAAGEA